MSNFSNFCTSYTYGRGSDFIDDSAGFVRDIIVSVISAQFTLISYVTATPAVSGVARNFRQGVRQLMHTLCAGFVWKL